MPTGRNGLATSVLNGKIYLIGGYVPGFMKYPGLTMVEVYDPAIDSWGTAPDMPTGRIEIATAVVDGKIYVFGGLPDWPADTYGIVEIFNPQGD